MHGAPTARRLVLLSALVAAACGRAPELGEPPPVVLPPSAAPKVEIESVVVDAADRKVVVTYRLTDRGAPVTRAIHDTLAPNWTLAWLSVEPVSGLPAWRSLLLTGSQTAASLPPGGPGTPDALRIANARQPGAETSGTVAVLPDGRFTYTFASALPAPAPPGLPDLRAETLRVGVFLRGATGTADTNATHDFIAAGGTPASHATVRDENCNACHGTVAAHGGRRVGVKLCLTCHTWQNVDPDTSDPAAMNADRTDTSDSATLMARAAAKRATDPNPLELGRLVHRLHRGRSLPTLYRSSTCYTSSTRSDVTKLDSTDPVLCNVEGLPPSFPPDGPPPAPPPPPLDLPWTVPALPFRAGRNTAGPVGLKYSVLGEGGVERVGARVVSRVVNFQAAQTLVEGIGFPQDLRNCDACHAGAPEVAATVTSISRRTCAGCHPDAWFGPVTALADLDAFHMPHSGGPQADDAACVDCHVTKRAGGPTRWAPVADLHLPPAKSPRYKKPVFEIVDLQGLRSGTPGTPGPADAVLRFKVRDSTGTISPLNAPTPLWDPDPIAPSPARRAMTSLTFRLGGPNTDFVTGGGIEALASTGTTTTRAFSWSVAAGTTTTLPWVAVCKDTPGGTLFLSADANGIFTCTFANPFANLNLVPGQVEIQGTWTLMIEGRRGSSQTQYGVPAPYTCTATSSTSCAPGTYLQSYWPWYGWILGYDPVTDTFRWPGTGETVTEGGENVFASFDVATGTLTTSPSSGRRRVVSKEKCNACHLRLAFHGGTRVDPNACLFCHAADATDWMYRPRDLRPTVGTGVVLLSEPLEYPADSAKAWTYWTGDGLEERSIQLKTMIHRLHTGEREGAASLEGIRPFLIHTSARGWALIDDLRYPGDLANCEACHMPGTWRIEAVPSTAMPTVANEQPFLLHLPTWDASSGALLAPASQRHDASLDGTGPVTSACLSCHTSGAAVDHAASKTSGGVEACGDCHGEGGAESVRKHHAVP